MRTHDEWVAEIKSFGERFPERAKKLDAKEDTAAWIAWRRWRIRRLICRQNKETGALITPWMDKCMERGWRFSVPCYWPWDFDPSFPKQDTTKLTNVEYDLVQGLTTVAMLRAPKETAARELVRRREQSEGGKRLIEGWRQRLIKGGVDAHDWSSPKVYLEASKRKWAFASVKSMKDADETPFLSTSKGAA